ncbi:uncharacterized protein J8A68_004568 [[Candida] subhashii]|uniref:Uncharacterized protein n=1 Tax=[Candida] subhashii TaxID=561895 RepID=A0A8J5QIT8_9ASCO|nr:uncharacterized protein J8A68_004568 [[Candida] subhashii]KAG7661901.1 hypothetical protein J8A68_004568 [[Candida] subhashii]
MNLMYLPLWWFQKFILDFNCGEFRISFWISIMVMEGLGLDFSDDNSEYGKGLGLITRVAMVTFDVELYDGDQSFTDN